MEKTCKKTYFEEHALEMLEGAGFTKAKFAKAIGIVPQNIKKVFETKNVHTLMKVAETLGVSLDTVIYGKMYGQAKINGFIEVNSVIYKVSSKEDIENVLTKIL